MGFLQQGGEVGIFDSEGLLCLRVAVVVVVEVVVSDMVVNDVVVVVTEVVVVLVVVLLSTFSLLYAHCGLIVSFLTRLLSSIFPLYLYIYSIAVSFYDFLLFITFL